MTLASPTAVASLLPWCAAYKESHRSPFELERGRSTPDAGASRRPCNLGHSRTRVLPAPATYVQNVDQRLPRPGAAQQGALYLDDAGHLPDRVSHSDSRC